jgi:murein DD-endopeptidase MepM/ murein hydrolase activator NlpD
MPPKSTNKNSVGRANATAKPQKTQSTTANTAASKPNFTLGAGGQIIKPTFKAPVQGGKVTQKVGATNSRRGYGSGRNEGLDLAAPRGTDVIAGGDYGTVIGINPDAGAYGNQVVIQYPHENTALYNHLDSFGNIKKGQKVSADDVIGQVGSTGNTTGPHLDFEVTKNGVSVPAANAFTGYQFEGFNGGEQGVSDVGYNRSNKKFYSLGDLGSSPGGSVYASGSGVGTTKALGVGTTSTTNSGSRAGSFSTGTSAASGYSGGVGQQVNLGALNQTPMRRTKVSSTTPVSASSVGYVPPQTTNPGTVTSSRTS